MRNRAITRRSVFAAAAVALAVSACGSGTPGQEADEDSNGDSNGDVTTVTFWHQQFQDQENEWYKELVKEFNASQDEVRVKHEIVPADAWEERLTAAQAANRAPDIRTMNYGGIRNAAKNKEIQPLSSLISEEAWGDLKENVLPLVTIAGEQYAYPVLVEPSAVLWYRTDMFEAAGLDPEQPPETWEQLVDYAEKLTNDTVFGMRLAQTAADAGWSTWGYQHNLGGLPISDDWSTAEADDRYAPLLQAFKDLADIGALPPQEGIGYADASPFGEGKFAMMANGSWAASQLINDYPDIVDKVAVAPMPSFTGEGKPTATLGGWTMVVDGKTENAEAAAEFIEWALGGDPEHLVDFFEITKFSKSPARTSVDEAVQALPDASSINPWQATIAEEVVPFAAGEASYPWDISLAMGEAVEAVAFGDKSVEEALAAANEKIQKVIGDQSLAGTNS